MDQMKAGAGDKKFSRREFHISREWRDRCRCAESLFTTSGNIIFANFQAVRTFVHQLNKAIKSEPEAFDQEAVRAGQVNAMGLIDEILHLVVALYRESRNMEALAEALRFLEERLEPLELQQSLIRFCELFPPLAVYRGEITMEDYFSEDAAGHREAVLEEMLLLWLANVNPAFAPFRPLFADDELSRSSQYEKIIHGLREFFLSQPQFGPDNQSLIEMLRSPAVAVPHSLAGQLNFIRERWGALLGKHLRRLLSGLDMMREEAKAPSPHGGPGPLAVMERSAGWFEGAGDAERFSSDRDWMPKLVLMAKTVFVWLDQLRRMYGRPIHTLDQIPDEELDRLAGWGISGIWLIGIWERSTASRKIKQLCGNPEAMASAYSLFRYQIAPELGGEAAFENLRQRAWQRGIRLAADMVPNHMGIDSPWLSEHPDWFVQSDHSPFPSYDFQGPDLGADNRSGIFLENHYYNRRDAAVVFKRTDWADGRNRYIYHGNDGTHMPWNDTAQLNYLKAEVRQAVIDTILQVARQFPIIRFDAAMTLTRRHFQRLWFPQPGGGGDIPSRTEAGLSQEDFDRLMPDEFWRQVVEQVAREAPDTLLLAEAFWLMESYFVRNLGMHRVYNSLFMNALKNEENDTFRHGIKSVLEFNPEILSRYVNFMNNPDEETAAVQFGKEDKYFGVCLLMVTLPGLPMFGHGQVEGFAEKYGMEYGRAYWSETPDQELIRRHQREIFPLLRRRELFAGVGDFLFYDVFTAAGKVDENVIAYSNRRGDETALVIFHNRYRSTAGWIRTSVAYAEKGAGSSALKQKTLGEWLDLVDQPGWFVILPDHISGLEFIRPGAELATKGLYVELGAYQHHLFLNLRRIRDDEQGHYQRLCVRLNGRGVPSIDRAIQEAFWEPLQLAFDELCASPVFQLPLEAWLSNQDVPPHQAFTGGLAEMEQGLALFYQLVKKMSGAGAGEGALAAAAAVRRRWQSFISWLAQPCGEGDSSPIGGQDFFGDEQHWQTLRLVLALQPLAEVVEGRPAGVASRGLVEKWGLDKRLPAGSRSDWVLALLTMGDWLEHPDKEEDPNAWAGILAGWFQEPEIARLLEVYSTADGTRFSETAFLEWLGYLSALIRLRPPAATAEEETQRQILLRQLETLSDAAPRSGFMLEKMLDMLSGQFDN